MRAELQLQPRERVTLEVPQNVPDDAASLLALYAAGDVERAPSAGGSVEEALAAVAVRAPRGILLGRLKKDCERLTAEVDRGEKKLSNEKFVSKAAPDVVAKEREKLEQYRSELARTREQLREMGENA
jgi:valyl-tRNA synthetase